jgi:hypothetical protein
VHSEVLIAEFNSAKVGPLQIAVTAEGATEVLATDRRAHHGVRCERIWRHHAVASHGVA